MECGDGGGGGGGGAGEEEVPGQTEDRFGGQMWTLQLFNSLQCSLVGLQRHLALIDFTQEHSPAGLWEM